MIKNKSRLRGTVLLIVLAIISALLITACGGGEANSPDTSTEESNTDSEASSVETLDLPTALPEDLELNVPNANEIYAAALESTDGEELYVTFCAKCHGLQGYGDGPSAGSLHIEGNFALTTLGDRSDEELLEIIKIGKGIDMPPWGLLLSNEQIEAALVYVRTLGAQ